MREGKRDSPFRSGGMTVIEVMMSLFILGLVAAGISAMLASARQGQDVVTGQNETQKWAQRAIDAIVDTLRGFSEVQTGNRESVVIAQKTKDGVLIRIVRYYVQSGELLRDRWEASTGQNTTGERVCGNVSNLEFHYYQHSPYSDFLIELPVPAGAQTQSLRASVTIASGKNYATETSLVKFRNKH